MIMGEVRKVKTSQQSGIIPEKFNYFRKVNMLNKSIEFI